MTDVNFVPDDYIQKRRSSRTNSLYLVLLLIMTMAIGAVFGLIKLRQYAIGVENAKANSELAKAEEAIKQLEQLQVKRRLMMKNALTTMELVEPVSKSVLLASLTNSLPAGVSLTRLKLIQKAARKAVPRTYSSKYEAAKAKTSTASQQPVSPEKLLETNIEIEGLAPSDIYLAAYIESLNNSILLNDVALVLSKEKEVNNRIFRRFKLTAKLNRTVHLTKEDVAAIRNKAPRAL